MSKRFFWAFVSALIVASCGGSTSDGTSGGSVKRDASGGACGVTGQPCGAWNVCCSGVCGQVLQTLASGVGRCNAAGAPCSSATDCCSLVCKGGLYDGKRWVSDDDACT